MDVACITKLEELKKTYTFDSLDPFFALEQRQTLYEGDVFNNELVIYTIEGVEVGSIWLEVTLDEVYIHLLQRSSKQHKGIMKQILYLIICKAIQLNLPITFRAVPTTSPSSKRVFEGNTPKGNLYSYYETIGFTPVNSTKATHNRHSIEYHTSVNTLKGIVQRWSSTSREAEGGRRNTRRHKRRTPL
jgi:hypothetical protein